MEYTEYSCIGTLLPDKEIPTILASEADYPSTIKFYLNRPGVLHSQTTEQIYNNVEYMRIKR
jgi:hypothetical protein